ncbi:DoxX family protein [Streptomyces sp. NPDC047000]|uniref:DoxX family protein n=1 Tax=Streptomyces sp. NPDC047000 TaxID=3155474 RepID=UPI0033FEE749
MNQADAVALLPRLVLGVVMIAHRLDHWRGGRIAGTARWFTGPGLTHGTLQAWLSVISEVGGGMLLAAFWRPRPAPEPAPGPDPVEQEAS